jgi:hypothetical protein
VVLPGGRPFACVRVGDVALHLWQANPQGVGRIPLPVGRPDRLGRALGQVPSSPPSTLAANGQPQERGMQEHVYRRWHVPALQVAGAAYRRRWPGGGVAERPRVLRASRAGSSGQQEVPHHHQRSPGTALPSPAYWPGSVMLTSRPQTGVGLPGKTVKPIFQGLSDVPPGPHWPRLRSHRRR